MADDNHTAGCQSHLQLLAAKCIDFSLFIEYSTCFKDVIKYYYCQFSPVSA